MLLVSKVIRQSIGFLINIPFPYLLVLLLVGHKVPTRKAASEDFNKGENQLKKNLKKENEDDLERIKC